jgi:hypothetical protein
LAQIGQGNQDVVPRIELKNPPLRFGCGHCLLILQRA